MTEHDAVELSLVPQVFGCLKNICYNLPERVFELTIKNGHFGRIVARQLEFIETTRIKGLP